MYKAMERSKIIDEFIANVYGRDRINCINKGICIKCGEKIKEFKNELSKKEYTISGYCQKCQDEIFGE